MTHIPPPAEELRLLDFELRQLDARRAQLLHRRAWLVTALQAATPPSAPAPVAPPRPEASAPRVQNVLLALGGVLLTIAAMAFTLVGWGHLGIAGRALVLGGATVAVLAAPVPLLKRGLRSTAGSVAGLGLALTVLDAYALHEVGLPDVDATGYAAAASAVLAALWTAYGLLPRTSKLRLPLPAALVAAQLPLTLWAVAADAGLFGITAAVLVTAGFDTGVALRVPAGSVRITAAIGAYGMGAWGVWAAGWLSWTATGPSAAARAAALLLFAAGIALTAAWQRVAEQQAGGLAVTAGLLTVAALGGTARSALPEAWTVPAYLACGIALLATVRVDRLPETVRGGLTRASVAVQGLAVLWTLPLVGIALLGPVAWMERVWSGAPGDVRQAVTVYASWPPNAETVPVVLAIVAAVLLVAMRDAAWRPRALTGALLPAWATALVLPAVLEVPYAVGLVALGVTTAGALATAAWLPPVKHVGPGTATVEPSVASEESVAAAAEPSATWEESSTATAKPSTASEESATATAKPSATSEGLSAAAAEPSTAAQEPSAPSAPVGFPTPRSTATVLALLTSLPLAFLSLSTEPATLAVLSALTALFAAASWKRHLTPFTAPAALAYATALACATGAAAGWAPQYTALLVLAVPVAAALLAARLGDARAAVPVEVAGAFAALLAVGLAAATADLPMLALVLALCGVITAGTAIRPDRRPVGYASAALFVLATWVRLAAWDVGMPEAYTLPVTVPALLVGALRRRRDPQVSSWTAYGPGLAATLVPSLLAAWGDVHWTRPLLLGLAALAITLLGARHHLQAPLLIGASALALDALHELAPYIAQVTDALPRWVPPALAGLLLLALGATYEQRLRDVRRMRDVLGRMS
ncbi:SCO7613 C-terminal domain-containing membrane protein [Streptomyces sp. UG1]|uniref:SCO7613 C-terminal domain-containing membrane protein n=1 Tax=Streptomyces sp. UG1 TaxID=3417652 RepID=UPI003CE87397